MYNPPTTTTSTAAASSATSAANNSTNLIPPTSTRVPTRTGPGAFNLGKRDAFDGLAGINFGSGSPGAAQTMGAAIQSLNTPPISTTGNVVASRTSPRLIPPSSPGRGSRTPASVASELSAEERFPSIEDYERISPAPALAASLQPPPAGLSTTTDWRKALTPSPSGPSTNSAFHRPALTPQPSTLSVKPGSVVGYGGAASHILPSGARSQHTTGTAMKDAENSRSAIRAGSGFTSFQMADPNTAGGLHRRQSLNISSRSGPAKPTEPALPPRPGAKKPDLGSGLGPRRPSAPPKDWLTGQDTDTVTSPTASTTSPPPVPSTGGAPGLTRKLSASFIRRASQYGDLQQMSTGQSRKAGPPVPDKSSVPANRPTSDTSGDEEPEDATGSLGKQQGSRFRPSHTGRKQGSVYDLVDVGSGSRQPPPTSAKKSFDQFGRRQQSVHDLIDVTGSEAAVSAPIPFTARPRAESPQPLPSAKTPQSAEFRFPPIGQSSPPSTTRAEGVGVRRRPQSMFLSPSPSSLQVPRTPAEPSVPESPKTPGAQPESPRKIRHPRRNSIVDLVSKYEAMDAAAGARAAVAASTPKSPGGPPPPIASKPTTLQGHARNTSVIKRPSLDIPAPTQQGGRSPGPRTSPTVETSGRRMSISPSRRVPSPASLDFSQQQIRAPTPSRPQLSPVLAPGPTRPITPPTLSPSPERPYQGVASLISQWQKKSESSANSPRSSPKTWK